MAVAILTDAKNFEALKKEINDQSLSKLTLSIGQQNYNVTWDMVSLTYDQIKKLNAVFFPAVGQHYPSDRIDKNTLGWYWTSTLNDEVDPSKNPNAVAWNFNGASGTRSFVLEGKFKGIAMAVRLVKQVKAPANP